MERRTHLADNLVNEAEAYGYTLTIWGAGGLLIHRFGPPGYWEVLAYVLGAVAGFAVLAWLAFGGFDERVSAGGTSLRVVSMLHLLSTFGALALASAVIHLPGLPAVVTFLAVGLLATVAYNLLLLVEALLPERVT